MSINRINTFAMQQTVADGSNRVMSNLVNLQKQLASGYKASSYAELGGNETQILSSLTNKLQRSQTYVDNNTLIVSRLQNTNQALSHVIDSANSMLTLISQRRNSAIAGSLPFVQQMDSFRVNMTGQLNSNVENRYLFSGASTGTPPIKSVIPDPVEIGVPDTGYYQGSGQDITTLVQDDYSLTYNIRADDAAFQDLYAGVAQAIHAHEINDDESLASAYDLVQQGLKGVISLQAKANTNVVNVQNINSQQQSFQTYWKNLSDMIGKTDIVTVSTQISLDESTLTASYQSYAKIVGLRLSDYL